jgi:hypothetical protein
MRSGLLLLAALSLASAPAVARADAPDPVRTEAADRFDRAIRLVNAGDLSGGLAELQRAYVLIPSPVVLYNLGLVNAALNRPVAAVHALEKVVATPETLKPELLDRAREVLREQSDRIGQVAVVTNVKEGVVEVDNVEAARLPVAAPLDVAIGHHVIAIVAAGYAPARREVLVAGHEHVDIQLELTAIEGRLAHIGVVSRIPAADVLVDGERVGKTPLEATVTVAPGAHHVVVQRPGYVSAEHALTLQDGARGDVQLDPIIDKTALVHEGGWLAIAASETQPVVTVDGTETGVLAGPLELPAGPHRLRLERGGFLPAERDISVPLGATAHVTIDLEPTPETREKYVSSASSRRTWSWVTIGTGAVIAAAGATLAMVEQGQLGTAQNALNAVNATWVRGSGLGCDFSRDLSASQMTTCENQLNNASSQVNNDQTLRTVGWVAAGVGGATLVTGLVLLLTGDDPHRYDRPPALGIERVSIMSPAPSAGPSISIAGRF